MPQNAQGFAVLKSSELVPDKLPWCPESGIRHNVRRKRIASFGLARDQLAQLGATEATYRSVCFVPSVSAVAIADIDTQEQAYADISSLPPESSELDEFMCATRNEAHTLMTEELGMWIIDRLP